MPCPDIFEKRARMQDERFIHTNDLYRIGEPMAIGFILISTAPAKEHEVYNELKKIKEIVELHPLFGEYDLIVKLEAKNFNLLGQIVVDKIRTIPGVVDTKTLTGIKF
jgi:DNA-binding Lrp family transcriptional regulator